MAPTIGRVALDNGFHGSIPGDWVAPPPQNIQAEYNRETDQRKLLLTVLDILEAISNDVDIMTSVTTEFNTTGAAYKYIEQRIAQVKDKISSLPDENEEEEYSCFSLMFTHNG